MLIVLPSVDRPLKSKVCIMSERWEGWGEGVERESEENICFPLQYLGTNCLITRLWEQEVRELCLVTVD